MIKEFKKSAIEASAQNFYGWVIKQTTGVSRKKPRPQNGNQSKYWGHECGPCCPTSDAYGHYKHVTTFNVKERSISDFKASHPLYGDCSNEEHAHSSRSQYHNALIQIIVLAPTKAYHVYFLLNNYNSVTCKNVLASRILQKKHKLFLQIRFNDQKDIHEKKIKEWKL